MEIRNFFEVSPRTIAVLIVALLYALLATSALAEFGDALASYYNGDYSRAYKEFKEQAEKGGAEAQNNLGALYAGGLGVPRDLAEAMKWYRKAADQGNAVAQKNIAYMYATGLGLPKDLAEAAKWYRKAAEQGNALAQNNLAVFYAEGSGVPKNYSEAEMWFRKAADRGLPEAQNNLTKLLQENGRDLDVEGGAERRVHASEIPLEKRAGVYLLPVRVNGVHTLLFLFDTGVSEVNIPADVVSKLLKTGAISATDFLPGHSYRLADGSIVKSSRLMLRELEAGGVKVRDVPASIVPGNGSLLLGQSFLGRLKSWSLDNQRRVLIIGGSGSPAGQP